LWFIPQAADASPYAPWLLTPLLGLLIYRISVVMHDCVHLTLFNNRHLNSRIGLLLGAMTGIDFQAFSRQHWLHHRIFGKPDDPQGFHYAGLNAMTPAGLNWHLVKPVFGLNLLDTFHESILAPRNLWRIIRSGEVFVVAAVQAVILVIVSGGGRHPVLAVVPLVSAATFGLFFSQLRGIAEHGAVGSTAEPDVVRSHAPHWLDRILLHDVNFNFHREHHIYPQCPSCNLPAVHRAFAADSGELGASMFGTLRSIHAASRSPRG
jgi:fatty acid desaturase